MADTILQRLEQVRARIRRAAEAAGRQADSVRLVAVSKGQPVESLRAALDAGQYEFGENYLQEALGKLDAVADERAVWHFIGPLQSNKTRDVAMRFHWVQSLDREKIARRLSDQRPATLSPLNVLVQINISGEASKAGVTPDQALTLCRRVCELPRLRLRGLMAIPEHSDNEEAQRSAFGRLRDLFENLRSSGLDMDTLSMGMSADVEAAVKEGATMVRIGTAIFGPRSPKRQTE